MNAAAAAAAAAAGLPFWTEAAAASIVDALPRGNEGSYCSSDSLLRTIVVEKPHLLGAPATNKIESMLASSSTLVERMLTVFFTVRLTSKVEFIGVVDSECGAGVLFIASNKYECEGDSLCRLLEL